MVCQRCRICVLRTGTWKLGGTVSTKARHTCHCFWCTRGSVISPGVSNLIVVLVTSPFSHACQSVL